MDPSSLLGPLESEVMNVIWTKGDVTVRDVLKVLSERRPIAYTTVMTVMNNLKTKGLLDRISSGKAFIYRAALTPEAFLETASREAVSGLLTQFGDLAIARFVEALADVRPEYIEQLHKLAARKKRQESK